MFAMLATEQNRHDLTFQLVIMMPIIALNCCIVMFGVLIAHPLYQDHTISSQ